MKIIVKLITSLMVVMTIAALFVATSGQSQIAGAISGKDFKPGNIIDDFVFYNSNSMSAPQIQQFLNAKVPTCDTSGSQISEFGGPDLNKDGKTQRWEWGKHYYNQTTFPCLKDYKQNVPQMEAASGLCGGLAAASNRTAAQIINDVASACGINPQVLLVLLQKEQSLVTDTWPLTRQYNSATGFDCPDTAPCDPQYAGLFYQIYYAARQFKVYKAYPNDYNYIAGRTNRIYWNPDLARCGSSEVYIENQATAALYIYTPYRPNNAALNNLYGAGDSCSSYGNRNFWRMFTDWFGSTQGGIAVSNIEFAAQPFSDSTTTVSFSIKNNSKAQVNLGRIKIEAWGPTGSQYNFPSIDNLVINSGAVYTYRQTINIPEEGMFTFNVARNNNGSWISPPFSDYGYASSTAVNVKLTKKPTIDQSLSVSSTKQHINSPFAATFRIRNNSSTQSVDIGRMKVEGRLANGEQYDFPSTTNNTVIAPNSTYTYSEQISLPRTGSYTFKLKSFRDAYRWSDSFPESKDSSIQRSLTISAGDAVTVISPLTVSTGSPHINSPIVATFKIKNFSNSPVDIGRMKVEGRLANGEQYDFPSTTNNLTLQPGETYQYSESTNLPKIGQYTLRLMNFRDTHRWSDRYPESENNTITRNISVNVKDAVTITEPLVLSATNIHANNTVSATFKIKNFSNSPVDIGRMKVEGRLANGEQYDFPSTTNNLTLQPGETYQYSESTNLPKIGQYTLRLMNFRDTHRWSMTYPANETSNITRSASISVKSAVTVTESLQLSATSSPKNSTVTASFKLKNFGTTPINIGRMKVEGRLANGEQYDFPSTPNNLIIQPGQTYTYTEPLAFTRAGNYSFKLMNFRDTYRWSSNYPQSEASNISRAATLTIN